MPSQPVPPDNTRGPVAAPRGVWVAIVLLTVMIAGLALYLQAPHHHNFLLNTHPKPIITDYGTVRGFGNPLLGSWTRFNGGADCPSHLQFSKASYTRDGSSSSDIAYDVQKDQVSLKGSADPTRNVTFKVLDDSVIRLFVPGGYCTFGRDPK